MTITIQERGRVQVVRLAGDLTGEPDASILEAVSDLLVGSGVRIVIDLAGVPFLNSQGLGELVRIAAQANIQECRVVMAAPTPFVSGVFQTTQLDRFFQIAPTLDDALERLR